MERLTAGFIDSHYELHDLGNDVSREKEKYKEIWTFGMLVNGSSLLNRVLFLLLFISKACKTR